MTTNRQFFLTLALLLGALGLGLPPSLSAQQAEANVTPRTIPVNHSGQYIITIQGGRGDVNAVPPTVPGIRFGNNPSRSSRMQIINGRMSSEITLSWPFLAETEGTFTVPGQTIRVGSDELEVGAVTFRVTPPDEALKNFFGMTFILPEDPVYLGQMFPVTLRFFLQRGVDANGLRNWPIEMASTGLVMTPIARNPSPVSTNLGDIPVFLVDFPFYATAVSTGEVSMEAVLPMSYRDPLGRRGGWQSVRLTAENGTLEVLPLPRENRPESFADAVGQFEVTAELSDRELTAGEPLTVTLSVTGQGNFDRMGTPTMAEEPGWRLYPPKTSFTGLNEAGYEGEKRFEFLLIPDDPSVEAVPPLAFSYFDPSLGDYREVLFEPEPVEVTGVADGPSSVRDFAAGFNELPSQETTLLTPDDLRPLLPALGTLRAPLQRPRQQTTTWALMGGGSLALLGLGFFVGYRRRAAHPDAQRHRKLRKAARQALSEARSAAEAQDAPTFLEAALRALREGVAPLAPRGREPETFTWEEVKAWVPTDVWNEELRTELDQIAAQSEAARFAPQLAQAMDTHAALAALDQAMTKLEGAR